MERRQGISLVHGTTARINDKSFAWEERGFQPWWILPVCMEVSRCSCNMLLKHFPRRGVRVGEKEICMQKREWTGKPHYILSAWNSRDAVAKMTQKLFRGRWSFRHCHLDENKRKPDVSYLCENITEYNAAPHLEKKRTKIEILTHESIAKHRILIGARQEQNMAPLTLEQ